MSEGQRELARQAIRRLARLAIDAKLAGQYVTMGRLAAQAVAQAEQLEELPLLLLARFWLADAWRMQARLAEAAPLYMWMIGLATDARGSGQVSAEWCQEYLLRAFMDLVQVGRSLPEVPVAQLQEVVRAGLAWVASLGRDDWTAGLRLARGGLLWQQGDFAAGRREMEAALALRRRYPHTPGPTLADYQLSLANLLGEDEVGGFAEAAALAEEVLARPPRLAWDHYRAYRALGLALADLGAYEQAIAVAHAAEVFAARMEGRRVQHGIAQLRGYVYRRAGQAALAGSAVAHEWFWAHQLGIPVSEFIALLDCAEVRILQARLALGLPAAGGVLPAPRVAPADAARAQRTLASARRFHARAQQVAWQLDQAAGTDLQQRRLVPIAEELDRLAAVLGAEDAA